MDPLSAMGLSCAGFGMQTLGQPKGVLRISNVRGSSLGSAGVSVVATIFSHEMS